MQSPEPGSSDTTRRQCRVLVVDDDPAIRLVCSTNLQLDGYHVLEAANGQEAWARPRPRARCRAARDQHAVLDGFGLTAALQADERTRELPLIFLTTEVDPLVKAKAFETGAHGVIEALRPRRRYLVHRTGGGSGRSAAAALSRRSY